MKKLIALLCISLLLVACQNDDKSESDNKQESVKHSNVENESKKPNEKVHENKATNKKIDKDKIKRFVESVYAANKVEEVDYLEEIANKKIQQVMYRQFMSEDFSKQDRYMKSVSNVKLFVDDNNDRNMLVSLEFKTKDTKEKKMSWQEKVVKIDIQNNKISNYEEIGSRPIYETQH
ncbi:hypothetical protein [Mammaliicoccus sp. D-M17]|uniref:hypothetical protein n=1 Tax=Mammaliicoccus sp. D-M17 TaxID=2898677 RepID=UPI001EFB4C2E|nr:hypothetical protein [Mammaliicoccus sp. D-M17]